MLTVRFENLPIKAEDHILDLGCGEGRHTLGAYQQSSATSFVGVDLSYKDLSTAKQRFIECFTDNNKSRSCTFIQSDGTCLPFPEQTFDHVICSEVLEHIHDYKKMLLEITRVLKPGGTLTISVPRAWPEKICWRLSREYHNVEGGHVRIFNAAELRNNIQALQYQYRLRHWAHALHVPYWWMKCLFWHQPDSFFPLRWYHQLLVWDLFKKPWITQTAERLLNPIMGKSVVMYFIKQNQQKNVLN